MTITLWRQLPAVSALLTLLLGTTSVSGRDHGGDYPGRAVLPGPKPKHLTKKIEEELADGTFYEDVGGAGTLNVNKVRLVEFDAVMSSICTTPTVTVRMVPAKNAHHLVHKYDLSKSDLDERGFLVGEIVNTSSTCTTSQLQIPPNGFLYWIARKNGGSYESQLIGPGHSVIANGAPTFKHCQKEHRVTEDDINHYPLGGACDKSFTHTAPPRNTRPFTNDEIIWVACDLGCCYADDLPEALRLTASPKSRTGN